MTTGAIAPIRLAVPGRATTRALGRDRIKQAIRRRAGRIWGLLLVLALLLPVLIISLLGRH